MEQSEAVLVVVEGTAACPYWMDHWGSQPEDGWSMLEREEGEPEETFAERLHVTLARCRCLGTPAQRVVLVAGGCDDKHALVERWELSTTLLTHLAQLGGGTFVLTCGHGRREPSPALAALASELAEVCETSGKDVRVHARMSSGGLAAA